MGIQDGCDQVGFDSRNPINTISTPQQDWDISGPQVTPDTLGPVIAILSWVFLDMWDVKYRSQVVAGEAASDLSAIALSRTNNRYS